MEEAGVIDWSSAESHVLLNPRMPAEERERLERAVPPMRGHVFVATSGTTGGVKLVALSKDAVLASGAAVTARGSSACAPKLTTSAPPVLRKSRRVVIASSADRPRSVGSRAASAYA